MTITPTSGIPMNARYSASDGLSRSQAGERLAPAPTFAAATGGRKSGLRARPAGPGARGSTLLTGRLGLPSAPVIAGAGPSPLA